MQISLVDQMPEHREGRPTVVALIGTDPGQTNAEQAAQRESREEERALDKGGITRQASGVHTTG